MRIRPLIFTPPRVPIDADLAWLLRAAFASDASPTLPHRPEQALQIARATQLAGRVAARLGTWRGGSSLGALAQDFSEDYYANIAKETLLMQAQQRIAELAERLEIPLIAVKFGGLRLARVISPGARVVSDLDILLPKARARDFWHALLAAGFLRTNTHEYSHQLEALIDAYGAVIDLHIHLPGVVVQGGFATADQLIAHGLVTRMPGGIFAPSAGVLAAHAIVHALVQNRSTPQTYSPLRMLSDVMDLRHIDSRVVHNAMSYLAPELGTTCETLERLCASLAEGAFDTPSFDGTSEQTLLWHCLAARVDFDYAERLRAAGLANKFRDGSSATEIARYIADLLYPSESALDFLYGPAAGTFGRVRRRMFRPLDLAIRAVRRSVRIRER